MHRPKPPSLSLELVSCLLAACALPVACTTPSGGPPDGSGGGGGRGGTPTATGGSMTAGAGGTGRGGDAGTGGGGGGAGTSGAADRGGTTGAGAAAGSGGGAGAAGSGGAAGGPGGRGGTTGTGGAAGSGSAAGRGGTSGSGGSGGRGGAGGSSGTGGSGGSGGAGGLPTMPDNGCNVRLTDAPIGFATMEGGTVGGGSATPIMVTTTSAFQTYLGDSQPRVLYVMNDLDFRTAHRPGVMTCADDVTCDNGSGMQIDEPRVSATCDPGEHTATSYRYETRLDIKSNKTVIGIGAGAGVTIYGASLNVGASSQIIMRNFTLRDINPHLIEAGDGITLQNSSHVWLDHLYLTQISDGFVDIGATTSSDKHITISWVHFDGRTPYECGGQHSYVNFSDNADVTYHHNFYDNCGGRNPKIGGAPARVHLFNNTWLNVSYFCITAQTDAQARVESNTFDNSSRPHWLQKDGNGTAGIAIDTGNVYTGASAGNTNRDTGGTVFTVPYPYTKDSAATARTQVMKCAGPQPIR
ncbi:MAG TPA: hypothetical protein VIF57_31020 [Polyangia bacterium]|jgi:pectate lyase